MAATAWAFYNNFRKALGNGSIDLTGTNTSFVMKLFKSVSNAATATLVSGGELTNECDAVTGGYQAGGVDITTVNWSAKTTASVYSWTFSTCVFTAGAASALQKVSFAVIMTKTASILVCYSKLSTAEFDVPATIELHIYSSSGDIAFELN